MPSQAKGSWFAILSALGFSSMPIFASYSYQDGATVETVLVWRFLLAALLLWAIVWWRKYPVKIGLLPAIQSMLLGVMGYAVMSYCYFTALTYISVSMTALLLYLYPVFVAVLSLLLRYEQWEGRKGTALAASILGMVLLIGVNADTPNWTGVVLGAAAGLVYSAYILASRHLGAQVHVLTMSAYTVTGAFFCLLMVGLLKGTFQFTIGTDVFASISAIALLSTVLAITLMNASIQIIGATKASIISTLEPMFSIVLAFVFFHETLTRLQIAGAALILFALLLLQIPVNRRLSSAAPNSVTHEKR